MGTPRRLSELQKARLFLRALNSFTMAEAALRHRDKLKPPFRSLVDGLLSTWEKAETHARATSASEAAPILDEFIGRLEQRMTEGEKDIAERFGSGLPTGPMFLAWGLFYLFKTRAQDLAEELAPPPTEPAAAEKSGEPTPAAAQNAPDTAALRDFQMALGLGP